MLRQNMSMFYISALIAITGAVGYQYFVKRVPVSINPVVSVMGIYAAVLVLGVILLPFIPPDVQVRLDPEHRQSGHRCVRQYHSRRFGCCLDR